MYFKINLLHLRPAGGALPGFELDDGRAGNAVIKLVPPYPDCVNIQGDKPDESIMNCSAEQFCSQELFVRNDNNTKLKHSKPKQPKANKIREKFYRVCEDAFKAWWVEGDASR